MLPAMEPAIKFAAAPAPEQPAGTPPQGIAITEIRLGLWGWIKIVLAVMVAQSVIRVAWDLLNFASVALPRGPR